MQIPFLVPMISLGMRSDGSIRGTESIIRLGGIIHKTDYRISMAFGLEARVTFLDVESVELGLSLPPEWKFHHDRPAKYLLRQAFAADLPEEITNRPKQNFSVGAGSSNVLHRVAEREIIDGEFVSEQARLLARWKFELPNKEALYYYRILRKNFEDRWIFQTLGQSRSL